MSGKDPSAGEAPEIVTVIFLSLAAGKTLTPAIVEAHAAHLAELDRKGRLVLAGPLINHYSGLIVLQTSSLSEAKAVAEEDPMIRGGFQTYELGTWIMANRQNHYQPNVRAASKQ
jgi:uncharacterized protein YciI